MRRNSHYACLLCVTFSVGVMGCVCVCHFQCGVMGRPWQIMLMFWPIFLSFMLPPSAHFSLVFVNFSFKFTHFS